MKLNLKTDITVKLEIEFESLNELFTENLALNDIDKQSKIREKIWNYIFDSEFELLNLYEEFKKKKEIVSNDKL